MKWLVTYILVVACWHTVHAQQLVPGAEKSAKKCVIINVPANYSNSHLAFFCRKEWQLEQKIKIPVRLRVGNIEQCNYLEQKPGYTLPLK